MKTMIIIIALQVGGKKGKKTAQTLEKRDFSCRDDHRALSVCSVMLVYVPFRFDPFAPMGDD